MISTYDTLNNIKMLVLFNDIISTDHQTDVIYYFKKAFDTVPLNKLLNFESMTVAILLGCKEI